MERISPKKRISPKEASTSDGNRSRSISVTDYLSFEEFPSEVQLEIIQYLGPETHLRSARVSKGFRVLIEEQKYEKKTLLFLQRGKDPVRIAIRKNNLDYLKYLLENKHHVYWGAILEILLLRRNEFLKIYDFEVRNRDRIALILRIVLETKNDEGYEIVRDRLKTKNGLNIYYWSKEVDKNLLRKIKNDFLSDNENSFEEDAVLFTLTRVVLIKLKEKEKESRMLTDKESMMSFARKAIEEDDIGGLEMFIDNNYLTVEDLQQVLELFQLERLVEVDILRYLMKKWSEFPRILRTDRRSWKSLHCRKSFNGKVQIL